mmetsp:Transcript_32287/g.79275  ORF Transcript_32287/g.79275 Transcript_32287/m.79275 type:complete len:400 (+) Transcript_32287:1181-2380(+)
MMRSGTPDVPNHSETIQTTTQAHPVSLRHGKARDPVRVRDEGRHSRCHRLHREVPPSVLLDVPQPNDAVRTARGKRRTTFRRGHGSDDGVVQRLEDCEPLVGVPLQHRRTTGPSKVRHDADLAARWQGARVRGVGHESVGDDEDVPDAAANVDDSRLCQEFGVRHDVGAWLLRALGVMSAEELPRGLAEVGDLCEDSVAGDPRLEDANVDGILVGEIVEDVARLLRVLAPLLVPKYQVDPLVQVVRHVIALQGGARLAHKLPRVALGPRRQHHVIDLDAILARAEVEGVDIGEEVWVVVELRHKLLHVAQVGRPRAGAVALREAVEQPVADVKPATLQGTVVRGVGLEAHKIVQHVRRCRVVRAVVKCWRAPRALLVPVCEPLPSRLFARRVEGPHGLG